MINPWRRPGGDSGSPGSAIPCILYLTYLCSGWWLWDSAPGCSRARTLLSLCQVSVSLWSCTGVPALLNHAVVVAVGPQLLGFVPHSTSPWCGGEGNGDVGGISAGTSGAFTQGFCVGESSPECPREGLGEQPCTPIEVVTPDLLHQGSTRSHQPLQVPGVVPWVVPGRGCCKPRHG